MHLSIQLLYGFLSLGAIRDARSDCCDWLLRLPLAMLFLMNSNIESCRDVLGRCVVVVDG